MRAFFILSLAFAVLVAPSGCANGPQAKKDNQSAGAKNVKTPNDPSQFLKDHMARVAPVEKAAALAYWKATTTGDKKAYDEYAALNVRWNELHSDPASYKLVKDAINACPKDQPLLCRQLLLVHNEFARNQIDPALMKKIVALSTEVQKTFSEFRGKVDGKEISDNEIKDILSQEKDSAKLQAAWEAYKAKGLAVREKVIQLVRLRNEAARKLGYDNYYQMSMKLMEQDEAEIQKLFDDLAQQTDQTFKDLMAEIRSELAQKYGLDQKDLRPWHYEDPFFQKAPALRGVDLDPFFSAKDPVVLVEGYFRSLGLDPADILARSDLYEKEGKMPHAYCTHMDRSGDVRVLANLKKNEQWTATLMHEMGHAVYDLYLDQKLPWLLRVPAHSFATEAVAMLFGRQTRNPVWLEKTAGAAPEKLKAILPDLKFGQRLDMLVFARWAMVMMNFERQMYTDPEQDLNKLWWDLKKRYQLLEVPEGRDAPDWASKIHVAVWPAYYHNYLLGELMASQVLDHLAKTVVKADDPNRMDLAAHPEVGVWLKKKIFEPGGSLRWDALIEQATGEALNAKYFAKQFIQN